MTATTPAAFDPKPRNLGTVLTMKAGAAILAGQAVVCPGTGEDWQVIPCDSDTALTLPFVGVALNSQATTGGDVTVASVGSVLLVCEGSGNAVDEGDHLMASAAAGCVITGTDAADATFLGVAVTDGAANGTFYALIQPQYAAKGA